MTQPQVQMVAIDELKPHPKNPRKHSEKAIKKLVASIREFGWTNPILVSEDGVVLAGHARLKAAKRAGLKEVPVIVLPLSGAKADAYMIADNRLQEDSDWDEELLAELVEELEAIDDKKVLINYKWYYVNERCERCYADWTVITVDWNGNVWYCCHKPDEVVGNLFKGDVLEAKRKWVTDMSKCDIPCRHTANNIILKEYREPKHVEFI